MDYQLAEQQAGQLQQQSQGILEQMRLLAQRFQTDAKDETIGKELTMALRSIALSVQGYQQMGGQMMQQMAQYIQMLEQQLQSHPQPTMQPRGWAGGMGSGFGGGFMGNLVTGLGLGAGMGVAENVVSDLFNIL
ncbi:hypothetical protein GALL_162580 [mine drainage metagenome]|uniref:Uncharacterized protein n=1 Tax=mine drainage metagenome TaxID=410659 RepID=A0A1J5SJ58_9ZZZZ